MVYDAVVVGLGGVGSFALRALGKQGKGGKFLGIERYKVGHSRGSSHGLTRLYRRAYFEHPSYVPWIEYSLEVFRELQESSGTSLMKECGTLLMESSEGDADSLPPMLQSSYDSAQEHDIPVEFLSHGDLVERFPQFYYGHTTVGLLEPNGGLLWCDRIMQAAMAEATASDSVSLMENAHVADIQHIDNGTVELKIRTDSGEEHCVSTRSLLLSAGVWTGQLVPSWRPHLSVTRQVQGWIDVSQTSQAETELFDSKHMPGWVMSTPGLPLPLYGVPCDEEVEPSECRHWLKVGIHGRTIPVPDPTVNDPSATLQEQAELQMSTTRVLSETAWRSPGVLELPQFAELSPCLYTMTADSHFLIGSPANNVFAVAGLSGHGFKMTPALGQMAADFALGKDLEPWRNEFCLPSRFGV